MNLPMFLRYWSQSNSKCYLFVMFLMVGRILSHSYFASFQQHLSLYKSSYVKHTTCAFLGSIVVSISACHAEDPGSIPGRGVRIFFPFFFSSFHSAWLTFRVLASSTLFEIALQIFPWVSVLLVCTETTSGLISPRIPREFATASVALQHS